MRRAAQGDRPSLGSPVLHNLETNQQLSRDRHIGRREQSADCRERTAAFLGLWAYARVRCPLRGVLAFEPPDGRKFQTTFGRSRLFARHRLSSAKRICDDPNDRVIEVK